MKVGIIGAGFTGLAAAYRLSRLGHDVTVIERDAKPGGLAIGYKEKGWEWSLEHHYHHWFTSDDAILNLAKEIGHKVIVKRPKTSSLVGRDIVQLDSPLTLLRFSKLSIIDRLRMAATLGFLRYDPFWQPLERLKTSPTLAPLMGKRAYTMLWEPLLINKFGPFAKEISLAWFWARIKKRTTSLAYPEGGFLQFAEHVKEVLKKEDVQFLFDTEVSGLTSTKHGVTITLPRKKIGFDKALVTLPSFLFLKLAPHLPDDYKQKLMQLRGIGAVNVVMRLTKPFFSDGTYWLNVCQKNAPVLAIVEHTNFMDKKHYAQESLVYLGNYVPEEHPYFTMSEKDILKKMDPLLKTINPTYATSIIGLKKFVATFAQPIIPVNYSKYIPPFATPLHNVYLANMQQVYPWDRGTNYAVELGEEVAKLLTD